MWCHNHWLISCFGRLLFEEVDKIYLFIIHLFMLFYSCIMYIKYQVGWWWGFLTDYKTNLGQVRVDLGCDNFPYAIYCLYECD